MSLPVMIENRKKLKSDNAELGTLATAHLACKSNVCQYELGVQ